MLTEEQIKRVAQIMSMNPGMTEAEAIAMVKQMPAGAMTFESTRGVTPTQEQGPAFGTLPGDVPIVQPSLMNLQGQITPRPEPQGSFTAAQCSQIGGTIQGGMCVIQINQ